jgi:hypothetical protein
MRWLALVALLGGCDFVFRLDHVTGPDAAPEPIGRWIDVAAGNTHTCALDEARHLFCWGSNGQGEVGVGTTVNQIDQIQQQGDATWNVVRTSYLTTCGIQTTGSLWCWGLGSDGQVGDGMLMITTISPTKISDDRCPRPCSTPARSAPTTRCGAGARIRTAGSGTRR